MSARPQQTGRAAEVRRVLSMFPQGATVAQIDPIKREVSMAYSIYSVIDNVISDIKLGEVQMYNLI